MKEVCEGGIAPQHHLRIPDPNCRILHSISESQGQALRATQAPLSVSPLSGGTFPLS